MCRQPDSDNQNAVYNSFIRECVKNLEKNHTAIVFFYYQVKAIQAKIGVEKLEVLHIDNYYQLNMKGN